MGGPFRRIMQVWSPCLLCRRSRCSRCNRRDFLSLIRCRDCVRILHQGCRIRILLHLLRLRRRFFLLWVYMMHSCILLTLDRHKCLRPHGRTCRTHRVIHLRSILCSRGRLLVLILRRLVGRVVHRVFLFRTLLQEVIQLVIRSFLLLWCRWILNCT